MQTVTIMLPHNTWKNAAFNAEAYGVDVGAICSVILTNYFDVPSSVENDDDPFGSPTVIPPEMTFSPFRSAPKSNSQIDGDAR